MLSDFCGKQHLIILLSPPIWERVAFFELLVLGKHKNPGKNLEKAKTFAVFIGQFQKILAILCHYEIKLHMNKKVQR